jgi:pectinesterase
MEAESREERNARVAWYREAKYGLFMLLLLALCGGAGAAPEKAARTMVVAQDGSGAFTTVQAAVDAVPEGNTERIVLVIKPGTYKEHLRVPKSKPFLTFRGQSAETTVLTFGNYAKMLGPDGTPLGTFRTPSTVVDASDFTAENLTFENSAGPGRQVGQAVAISVTGDRCVFRSCRFLGWQDTLYTGGSGRQYYRDCTIEGEVDFIFGYATVVFEHCRIYSRGIGYIAAHARTAADQPTGYVFRDCDLTGAESLAPATVYLARPWRPYSRVLFIGCRMGKQIRPVGWDNWRNPANEATAWFAEYHSSGPGANLQARVSWSRQLTQTETEPFQTRRFLAGNDGWQPG